MKPQNPLGPLGPLSAESALIQLLAVAPASIVPLALTLVEHPQLRPLYAALYDLVQATKPTPSPKEQSR